MRVNSSVAKNRVRGYTGRVNAFISVRGKTTNSYKSKPDLIYTLVI
jgi:hypothetical protein